MEGDVRKDFFQHGIQTARADIFRARVGFLGKGRDFLQPLLREFQFHAFRGKQGAVLLLKGIVRFGEDAQKFRLASG